MSFTLFTSPFQPKDAIVSVPELLFACQSSWSSCSGHSSIGQGTNEMASLPSKNSLVLAIKAEALSLEEKLVGDGCSSSTHRIMLSAFGRDEALDEEATIIPAVIGYLNEV
ncbi:hypothetical protein SCUP234_11310 [Seiridium cupressi]